MLPEGIGAAISVFFSSLWDMEFGRKYRFYGQ